MSARRGLRFVPALTLLALVGPVAAGLIGTLLPAFGYLPAAGLTDWGLAAFAELGAWPGLPASVRLSLTTGLIATALSLAIVTLALAGWQGTPAFRWIERSLSPLLSVPHAAAAFGIAFLIAPSGWVVRLFSPWATGWERPPDLLILQDPAGISLIVGLVAKEVPFLLLMSLAALGQTEASRSLLAARTLGYGRVAGWLVTVFPQVYRQIRLPVFVVLVFSMSVVDVAIILGPNTPNTLSVQIVRWMGDPDLALRLRAAAAAMLQLALVFGGLLAWRIGEWAFARIARRILVRGRRGCMLDRTRGLSAGAILLIAVALFAGIAGLALWSFAGFWSYPNALPDMLILRSWMRHGPELLGPLGSTALIAGLAAGIALVLTIGCLEAEHRHGVRMRRAGAFLLYLPLLIPQTAFLPGLQTLMLSAGLQSGLWPVVLAHVVFVLPYVFLSLADPFRAWDTRLDIAARSMGTSADGVLWRVRLPMLLAPLLTALAVGLAVSVGQYLPTLLVGGGRVQTLTTEAVALASGGDRRAIGIYGLAQTLAALLPFAAAVLVPRLVWRNRRGMRHDG
ncbi:ABC transporter permease [Pontivivens insulae]|uniref:Inner membrane ABC transporter permease protein YnjC n=1 Tax=Pontivivens insulae TaxID=1639689 RepID=A0A2R8A8T8_9RHOB|nr:ABC transporter permease subunit [Pontivivens insulae]RED18743.1 putative thiamine transport system permease protein [Pontivivens insulae]SPF28641.1 Inner membrane ABC transporter permease protein YnjC [Pontivivens insulae]